MSDIKKKSLSVAECYENLHELYGAVMDTESYEKHKAEIPALAQEDAAEYQEHETATLDDIFAAPQDLRQIAAEQIEADRRAEYRPECVTYMIPQFTDETCIGTETHFVLGGPCIIRCGSGSYLSSGSYGSYVTSGSYRTSGSYITSGSYRTSGSFRSSGSFHPGSGSFHLPAGIDVTQPYMGSFTWDFEIGGYGLNLI
ncbi:MAG: hypothetical protein LUE11_07305 [Clostridia bacterium]|nr:hypothetical protein [Clostridia bacterium]